MSDRGNLKSRFENYGSAPNANAWAGISAAMPSKSKKKAAIWWLFAGSGVAAAVLISFLMINSGTSVENKLAAEEEIFQKKDTEISGETVSAEANITDSNLTAKAIIEDSDIQLETRPQQKNTEAPVVPKADLVARRDKPLNPQNSNTAVLIDHVVAQKKDELTVAMVKAQPKPALLDLKIDLLEAQETPLLASINSDMPPKRIEEFSEKIRSWQWGGKLGSDFGVNTLPSDQQTSFENIDNAGVSSENSLDQNPTQPILFTKINRPVSASLLLRFSPTPKLFIEIDPTFSVVRAEIQKNTVLFGNSINGSFSNKSLSFSHSLGINIGYKVLNTKRWAIDLVGGINFEKPTRWTYMMEPFYLVGSSVQTGISYQVSEKASLRLAPEFSWVYGKSEKAFIQRFQSQNSLGLSLSILRDF